MRYRIPDKGNGTAGLRKYKDLLIRQARIRNCKTARIKLRMDDSTREVFWKEKYEYRGLLDRHKRPIPNCDFLKIYSSLPWKNSGDMINFGKYIMHFKIVKYVDLYMYIDTKHFLPLVLKYVEVT